MAVASVRVALCCALAAVGRWDICAAWTIGRWEEYRCGEMHRTGFAPLRTTKSLDRGRRRGDLSFVFVLFRFGCCTSSGRSFRLCVGALVWTGAAQCHADRRMKEEMYDSSDIVGYAKYRQYRLE